MNHKSPYSDSKYCRGCRKFVPKVFVRCPNCDYPYLRHNARYGGAK